MMGIYYMEKTCPRRLTTEFKDYREQISLHVKEEDSCFELLRTDQTKNRLDLWYRDPETGWMKAAEKDGNPLIPTGVFQYFLRHHDPVIEGTALGGICQRRREPHGVEQPGAGCTYLVGGSLWKKKTLKDCSIHPCCRSAI